MKRTYPFFLLKLFAIFLLGNVLCLASGIYVYLFSVIGIIYHFNTLVFPILAFGWGIYLFYLGWKNRNKYESILFGGLCFVIALSGLGIRLYATHIEPYRLQVHTYSISTSKVEKEIKILHISDIQTAGVDHYEEKVFDRIRQCEADLILFTGDLLQPVPPATFESEMPKLKRLFNTLTPPLGIYAVFGNVDSMLRKRSKSESLENVTFLQSNSVMLKNKEARIRLLGLTEEQSGEKNTRAIREWFEKSRARDGDIRIVMGHRPDYMTEMGELPIDLCLAGHTHGGQIVIPGFGALMTLSDIPRAWVRGYRKVGKTRIHVSAGIGCENTPYLPNIRFCCPPEMTLFTFRPAN